MVIGPAGATVGMAASLPLTSANLTVVRTCVLTASSASSAVAIDSGVQQGSPTTNFGTGATATVKSHSTGDNQRIYLDFDLSKCSPAIATSATVTLATLRLYLTGIPGGSACRINDIFKVGASWTETGTGSITWNNQPFGTTTNNPATSSRTDSVTVGPSSASCQNTTTSQYVTTGWNVTADVQSFVATPSTNFGWMIRDDAETSSTGRVATYSMRDIGDPAQGPQLILTYKT
jgi:hypothetical protein